MTWALPALGLVLVAVAAGLAWYERGRPTARVVALVATLAALAALGRIAFAPLPNVKPTTDIVLLSGFVLGGAPGFAVGAFAALTSNLVFGQGPWTPWQMAAWGAVGLLGALVARFGHLATGRWSLALAGALAGLLFGLVMDLSTWLTATAVPERGTLLAILATSAPFNLLHAAGNAVFAFVFGPAFVTALRRSRDRLDGRFVPAGVDPRMPGGLR